METSSVANWDPPSTSTTPKDVKENAKTSTAADAMGGRSIGRVTCRNLATGPAPNMAADSSTRGSRFAQKAETMRTTMA